MPKFLDLIQYVDNGVKWDNSTNPNDNGSDLRIIKLSQSDEPGTTIMRGPDGTAQISDPKSDSDIANKKYVDDQNANDVHLAGDQTISGAKTFNGKTVLSGGATVPYSTIGNEDSVINKKYMSDAISAAISTGQDNFPLTIGAGQYSVVQRRIKSDGSTVATEAYQRGTASFGGGTVAGDPNGNVDAYSFAFAANENNKAIPRASAVFGRYNTAHNIGEFVCGNYADNNRNPQTVFAVGTGIDDSRRSTGFEVRTDGHCYIHGKAIATEEYVGNRAVNKQGNDYVVYINEASGKSTVMPYRFNKQSILDAEYKLMFQPMTDGRLYTRYPTDEYHAANKGYVDTTWNKFNLKNGTGTGSLVQKTVSSSGTPYANEASGSGAVAMGKKVKSKGNATFVIGQENEAIAGTSASFTSGRLNVNRGSYNITSGENNANNNSWNLVVGKNNAVSDGRFGIVSGLDNVFTGLGSDENSAVSILGKNLYVQYSMPSDGALLIGRYNKVQNNPGRLFIVGNGTSNDDRKNAFEVLEDGRAKVYKKPAEANDVLRWQEKVGLETKINKINAFINTIFTDTTRVHFTESGSFGTGLWFSEAGIYRVKATYTYGSESGIDILIFSVSTTYNTISGGSYEIKILKNGNRVIATSDRQGGGTSTADQMQWIYLYSGTGGGTQVTNWKYEELNLADLGTIS